MMFGGVPKTAYEFSRSRTESHVYGYTTTNKTVDLIKAIAANSHPTLCLFCFRSKAEMDIAYNAIAKTGDEYNPQYIRAGDGEFEVHQPFVFCTASKLCRIILSLSRQNTINKLDWVLIEGWDKYNANEFAAVGMLNILRGIENPLKYRVVLLSISQYAELPIFEHQSLFFPSTSRNLTVYGKFEVVTAKIRIQYHPEKTPDDWVALHVSELRRDQKLIFYPGRVSQVVSPGIIEAAYPIRDEHAIFVVDSILNTKTKSITKHEADLRADSLNEGLVIRCISQPNFDKLRPITPPIANRFGLDRVVVFLFSNLPGDAKQRAVDIRRIFPKDHQSNIDAILGWMAGLNMTPVHASYIIRTGLNIKAGTFIHEWDHYSINKHIATIRNRYVGVIFACLLDRPPTTYGAVKSYKPFAGRNDLETMCNMWASLDTTITVLRPPRSFAVAGWCREHGFLTTPVMELIGRFQKLFGLLVEPYREGKQFDRDTIGNIRHPISTEDLNLGQYIAAGVYPMVPRNQTKWILDDVLPRVTRGSDASASRIILIHTKGSKLQMFLGAFELEDVEQQHVAAAEDFSDVYALFPDLFK